MTAPEPREDVLIGKADVSVSFPAERDTAVTEVLAAHASHGWDGDSHWGCRCGVRFGPLRSSWLTDEGHWIAHLAEALAPLIAERERAAAVEALREAADEADSTGRHWSGAPALAFFALAGDLRDRANSGQQGDEGRAS